MLQTTPGCQSHRRLSCRRLRNRRARLRQREFVRSLPLMWDTLTWHGWQSESAPELCAAAHLADEPTLVVLCGNATPRGRFGIVAIPSTVRSLQATQDAIIALPQPGRCRVFLLGYEMGAADVWLPVQTPPRRQPHGMVFDLGQALIVDHLRRRWTVAGADEEKCRQLREAASRTLVANLPSACVDLTPSVSDATHAVRIRAAQEHIKAGDIYQANVTRRLQLTPTFGADFAATTALIALQRHNPVPHGALIRHDGVEIVSNSMETLLTYEPTSGLAHSHPIKGTCARRPAEPTKPTLFADAKECAEHAMIVDLVRNDLGKVCRPGTVRVPKLMDVEGYHGVWHGVSTAEGLLPNDRSTGELIAALFPGGSITGAPKRRAVDIIHTLEGESRGFYTGSIGLITPRGRLSVSILIRTLVRDADGWSLSVGGGIVADSDPQRELLETEEKIQVFREVLAASRP